MHALASATVNREPAAKGPIDRVATSARSLCRAQADPVERRVRLALVLRAERGEVRGDDGVELRDEELAVVPLGGASVREVVSRVAGKASAM